MKFAPKECEKNVEKRPNNHTLKKDSLLHITFMYPVSVCSMITCYDNPGFTNITLASIQSLNDERLGYVSILQGHSVSAYQSPILFTSTTSISHSHTIIHPIIQPSSQPSTSFPSKAFIGTSFITLVIPFSLHHHTAWGYFLLFSGPHDTSFISDLV